jgi:hypothetical protein
MRWNQRPKVGPVGLNIICAVGACMNVLMTDRVQDYQGLHQAWYIYTELFCLSRQIEAETVDS